MFSFFKKKEQKLEAIGFEVLNCDCHSHFIPGIDDGSPDLETSVKLVRKMHELGFKKIITTPHIMHDFYRNTPEIILSGLEDLKNELLNKSIEVDISAAAEYYVDYYFESKLNEDEDFLTFSNKHILIETSFVSEPPNFSETIFKLQLKGYDVILAHPERYGFMSINDLKKHKNRSVKLQINLLSLLGYYGSECKLKAEKLIENNMVDFVGTDCHNLNQASIYHKCTTNKYWHILVNSGTLKNHLL